MRESYARGRAITKKHASTLYLNSRFLPKDKRNATYVVYAICRITDDAVDCSAIPSSKINGGN